MTNYRKLTETILQLKKNNWEARFNYWNWRFEKKLDLDPVGQQGPVSSLFSSLRVLSHLTPTYMTKLQCSNPVYFHNKNPQFEEVSWKIPLPLSINDSEIERCYNNSWSNNNLKCSKCKLNTKKIITPNDCEPEFIFLMLDFVQNELESSESPKRLK